jgi:hypothetical protein
MATDEVYAVRARALRDYANQLATELEGPFPKGLREHGAGAVRYLRTCAADCERLGELTTLAVDLAACLSNVLLFAENVDAGAHPQTFTSAHVLLRRADRELKHVR